MKTLVLIVHGGNAQFRKDDQMPTREILKNTYSIDLGTPSFGEVLDKYLDMNKFEVLAPLFPNAVDANYEEWARFFEQVLDENNASFKDIILIGHSLGTTFLQCYLATHDFESSFGLKIKQVHFVGCCVEEGNFKTVGDWQKISDQSDRIFIYHSTDDPVCDFSNGEYFADHLPKAEFLKFQDRGHFEMENLPELNLNINNIDYANS